MFKEQLKKCYRNDLIELLNEITDKNDEIEHYIKTNEIEMAGLCFLCSKYQKNVDLIEQIEKEIKQEKGEEE